MKYILKNEFLVIGAFSLLLVVFIALGWSGPPRVALGLPFVLFFPGYTLIAALFPKKDDLDGIERVALSFGLSIAVVPLVGLILNYTPWGIRLAPILVSLLVFTGGMSALAVFRRNRLAPEERFQIEINLQGLKPKEMSRLDKALSVALAAAIIFALGSICYVVTTPKAGEKFTEFYILGPGGKAEGYPREMRAGEEKEVILGVVNHEYRPVTYRVEVRADGRVIRQLGPYGLDHEEKGEETVRFAVGGEAGTGAPQPRENIKVEFLLFREEDSEPYRSLHIWVNTL
ncbi:MAG: DUF1616 domain-containing protein [Eubacteriales bacterium]